MDKQERHLLVGKLFRAALELAPEAREAFLAASCSHDPELLSEVRSLISADEKAGGFLIAPAIEGVALSPDQEATVTLAQGTEWSTTFGGAFAHYQMLEPIGKGGMGEVFRARDSRLGRAVAIKFLPESLQQDKTARKRFSREARSAAALDHPFICKIYEAGCFEGRDYIVMEYVEGTTLQAKLAQGILPHAEALRLAVELAEALEKAHKKGIIHRDLKPSNIMLTAEGHIKIMDFGLARLAQQKAPSDSLAEIESQLTEPGAILGTVPYMSPEQVNGKELDGRSDIFSFGVVLYEMLSGHHPFAAESVAATISAILTRDPSPLARYSQETPDELQQIVSKTLNKNRGERYQSTTDLLMDLNTLRPRLEYQGDFARSHPSDTGITEQSAFDRRRFLRRIRKPRVAVPAVGMLLLLILGSVWFFNRQTKVSWAREVALPEIERLIDTNWRDFTDAYNLAEEAEKYIPNDPRLAAAFSKSSLNININTEPAGASIYMKEYRSPESEWKYLGISPIENIRLPIGIFRWKMEKEGYETVLASASTWNIEVGKKDLLIPNDLVRVLDVKGSIPPGMVRVRGAQTPLGRLDDFFIDRYEVTNKQFKAFIDSGGYSDRRYWKPEFIKAGRVLMWEEAMAEFVDQTGRPGPATWQAGDYPDGQGDHPVSGISWYEAAAYAAFVGKSLPTGQHWGLARGEYTSLIRWPHLGGFAVFAPFSNFEGKGPVVAGSLPGITSYGACDMAGNVREWCWNETAAGRLMRGGAWNDNPYRFTELAGAPAFDRSIQNGFRCALYANPEKIPESAFAMTTFGETRDFYKENPVSDDIFQVYQEQFSYDKTDPAARLESRDESSADWIHERITYDAAYGNERIIAHLFLPKKISPPYQTVIYVPGSASLFQPSSEGMESYYEFPVFLSFLVKNGRAVLYPVYKGTFERRDDALIPIYLGDSSHLYRDYLIQVVKDFRRSIDYLETRQDIDRTKLAYYGMSWGGMLGAIIPAVEKRLQTTIILGGGLTGRGRPEANQTNYITRVKMPTLMLSGKYDTVKPYETTVKPMFDLLGTPNEHKELKLYETDHIPPMNDFIKEILAWLDRYLGSVK
jgi:serine/threonine protein kinase/cephalosporin-C deacetylase-like acetyl esterase